MIPMTKNNDSLQPDFEEDVGAPSWVFTAFTAGFVLVIAGIAVIFAASLAGGGSGSFGGVIFIGPFPIVFGSGPNFAYFVLIGVIVTAISIVLFFIMRRRFLKEDS